MRIVVYLRGPRRSKIIIIVVMILQRPDVSPAVRLGGRKLSPSIHLGRARNSLSFVGGFPHSCHHRRPPLFHLCISFVFFRFFLFLSLQSSRRTTQPFRRFRPAIIITIAQTQCNTYDYFRCADNVFHPRTWRPKLFRAFHLQSQTNRRYNIYG